MTELGYAALVFVLLLGGTGLGVLLKPLLPEEHRKHETVQLVQLVVGMLVTFAALVLSLLTASAKTSYDTATDDMRATDRVEHRAELRAFQLAVARALHARIIIARRRALLRPRRGDRRRRVDTQRVARGVGAFAIVAQPRVELDQVRRVSIRLRCSIRTTAIRRRSRHVWATCSRACAIRAGD